MGLRAMGLNVAQPLREILDYLDYANGRGQPLTYQDFLASDVRKPLARPGFTVVFPAGWADARRETWRRRHKLAVPEAVIRQRTIQVPHAIAGDECA